MYFHEWLLWLKSDVKLIWVDDFALEAIELLSCTHVWRLDLDLDPGDGDNAARTVGECRSGPPPDRSCTMTSIPFLRQAGKVRGGPKTFLVIILVMPQTPVQAVQGKGNKAEVDMLYVGPDDPRVRAIKGQQAPI